MIELKCPEETKATSHWLWVTGREGIEVFTIKGVEYIRCSLNQADIVIVFTRIGNVKQGLRRLDATARSKPILCHTHKGYTAQRRPRTNCPICWEAYNGRDTSNGNVSRGDSHEAQRASNDKSELVTERQDTVAA